MINTFASFVLIVLPFLASTTARAQSMNLDFQPLNSPVGTAASAYGGPAQYSGTWNSVHAMPTTSLLSLSGAPTGASVTTDSNPSMIFFTSDAAVPPDESLVDDGMRADLGGYSVTVSGLANGLYAVFVVCVESVNLFPTRFELVGAPEPPRYCGGAWSGAFVSGTTSPSDSQGNYLLFTKTVTDGTIRVQLLVSNFVDLPTINGLQIVKLEPVTSSCFGDSGSLACPCGNIGLAGHGCGNSANASGALLTAAGAQVPDTLVLTASGLPSTAPALFVQAQTFATQVPFGDGTSCLGGVLLRLYLKFGVGGSVIAPLAGDPSITARSALSGDVLLPGSTRHYQVVYRDAVLAFCSSPQGGTFNTTNALSVAW